MKQEVRLLDAIGSVRDRYVLEAAPVAKKAKKKNLRWLAAMAALVLGMTLFLQTAPGAAAVEYVKEQVISLIETLFPPREIVSMPEGDPEANTYEAHGREPEENTPGFAMYIDPDGYTMTEEDGIYYVRPLNYDPESPLVCEMVIQEFPDAAPMALAQQVHAEMVGKWESVTEIWTDLIPVGVSFNMWEGMEWDSMHESHYFVDNGRQGCYQIVTRYFMEAAEGHGSRFYTMLSTFTLIAPQDTPETGDRALAEAIRQEISFTKKQCDEIGDRLASDGTLTQADMNELNEKQYALWLETLDKVWSALEQTLSPESMENLTVEQLEWSTGQEAARQAVLEDMGEGSLAPSVLASRGADSLGKRVDVLVNYLDGSFMIPEKAASETDPEGVVKAFSDAYFSRNTEAMKPLLSQACSGSPEAYTGSPYSIHAYLGMDNVIADMARRGSLYPSVEFRTEEEPDSYTYLSITLVWEEVGWKVASYGLEK